MRGGRDATQTLVSYTRGVLAHFPTISDAQCWDDQRERRKEEAVVLSLI